MFAHCWAILMENMWQRSFQNGGGIILLLEAPTNKSKFAGFKSRKRIFLWFREFWTPWEPLFVDYTKSLQRIRHITDHFEKYYFAKSWNLKNGTSGKDACRNILKILLINSWRSWIWAQYISILTKTWIGYLPENLGILKPWTLKLWNFETFENIWYL